MVSPMNAETQNPIFIENSGHNQISRTNSTYRGEIHGHLAYPYEVSALQKNESSGSSLSRDEMQEVNATADNNPRLSNAQAVMACSVTPPQHENSADNPVVTTVGAWGDPNTQ